MSDKATLTDEMIVLAEALGELKGRFEKIEGEFLTQAKPLEAATTALQASLAGLKSLQFHVLDNNLGQLSARVEQYRGAIAEQVEIIATELKRADEDNAKKSGEVADGLRAELATLRDNLGQVVTQFGEQLERVQLEAAKKAKEFAAIPGPMGPEGRSISGRGQYAPGTRYAKGDVVGFLGGSYLSNDDDNDEKPGAKAKRWTQLVSRAGGVGVETFWNPVSVGIAYTGPIKVGTTSAPTPAQYNQLYVETPAMTENVGRGINCTTTYSGANAATGYNGYTFTSGSSDMDHIHGYQSTVYHNGSGTLARSAAYQAFLEANNGGTVSLGVGFYFAGVATGTGGTFTEAWAFYDIGGSPTRHSGKVYIGEGLIAPVSLPNTQLYVTRDYAEISGGLSSPTATFRSTDTAAVGTGGSIALGGESGAATTPYNFAFSLGAKEQAGATYNGYLAFYTTDTGSNNSEKARITSAGNLLIGTTTDISGSNGLKVAGARVNFSALPTSASGLVAGDLWNDGGTVKVVT